MCVYTHTHTQTVIHNVGNVKTFGILLLGEGHTGVHWPLLQLFYTFESFQNTMLGGNIFFKKLS